MKRTKIVATIGPASDSKEKLFEMIKNGMNVARINFSHGTHESNGRVFDLVRELSVETKRPIGLIADLQGPRMRVGNTESFLIEKDEIIFVSDHEKKTNEKELVIDSDGVASAMKVGDRILIEDGLHRLEVVEKNGEIVKAKVVNGGEIKPRKNMNFPDTKLTFGAVTKKDELDLVFAMEKEADFVALSFVSNGKEIEETREKMKKILGRDHSLPQIISKVERSEAMKNIDEIIKASDVIMVARGDLGIEMDESMVVIYQKEIIAKCLKAAKPVIVATQMLDSMINNPIPTRAEVSDVSNAVIDHTDAVMLSGESANGKYPAEAVATMNSIIKNVEDSVFDDVNMGLLDDELFTDYASLMNSAHEMAKSSKAKAILLFTKTGFTARIMSHHRPEQLMIAATNSLKTYNQLSIVWGIRAYVLDEKESSRDEFIRSIIDRSKKDEKLFAGDKVVVILGRMLPGDKTSLAGIYEVE
jgi:pyruvate kinase